MIKADRGLLESVAWDASIDVESLYWTYSGRGMYSKVCFGIVGSLPDYSQFLVQLALQGDGDLALELADRVVTDNLGRDTIFYFPGFLAENEESRVAD